MVGVLWAGLLFVSHLAAQEQQQIDPNVGAAMPVTPEPYNQWLDEVRAQRQAREERRRAAKEAIDARRRWIDPWGAAEQEAREQEVQRRRDAFKEKIEREREVFRTQTPWSPPRAPWEDSPTEPESAQTAGTEAGTSAPLEQPVAPPPLPYTPPGWDNRWYYRGY
jgi:hypothetical protein